jgi:hypothetical protein
MRAWRRTPVKRVCGRCGHVILPGEPLLALTFATAPDTVLYRCAGCCGPAPDELPELPDDRPSLVERLKAILLSSHPDWKKRHSGEDE